MPRTISIANAVIASVKVTGNRSTTISQTDLPENVDPKSPVKMSCRYFRYWTMNGSSRLNCSVRNGYVGGVLLLARARFLSGSPSANMRKYMMKVTPKNTGIIWSRRRIT